MDDGAVIYLNGTEVYRFNLPTGGVSYSTMAVSPVLVAGWSGPFTLPSSNWVAGDNLLAAELHRTTTQTNAGLRISRASGYTVTWDGGNGDYFSPTEPALAPTNAAMSRLGGDIFVSSNTNLATNLVDGRYGNSSSWSPTTNDTSPFIILRFNQVIPISSIAWSRDNGNTNEPACGGTCSDRALGNYTFQYTLATNPAIVTALSINPSNGWASIATVQYVSAQPGFDPYLRHRFDFAATNGNPILATGLRLRPSTSTTLDEIEINPPAVLHSDAAFGLELAAVDILPPPPKLVFNEASGASSSAFWLEIMNCGGTPVDLTAVEVVDATSGLAAPTFPAPTLPPGGILALSQAQLGFGAADGDKLFLYTAGRYQLLDSVVVKKTLRGRHPDGSGDWMRPALATPGGSNSFELHDEIVFNELMYHYRPTDPIPAVASNALVLPITGSWRFNDTGTDLGAAWRDPAYDDAGWPSGSGLLYVNPGALPAATNTALTPGRSTYYFRTAFDFSGPTSNVLLNLHFVVDDGAVFYLNGAEVYRLNLPTGAVTYATFAATPVGDATLAGPIAVAGSNLVQGRNLLAVEVHQFVGASTVSGVTLSGGGLKLLGEGPAGGAVPMNLARQPGAAPFVIDSLSGYPIHDYLHLNDGIYGNPNSWIGNSGNPGYAGVRLGGLYSISSFAFGRDNLGTFTDRCLGTYTLQYTRVTSPGTATTVTGNADTGWATIGTLAYQGAGSGLFTTPSLRHVFSFDPVMATGLRLVVPGTGVSGSGTCIDELEVNPPNTTGDIAFGAEAVVTTLLVPAVPFTKSSEQWVELFNRGSNAVDLSGWQLDSAIHFTFPIGTTMVPGSYLVVANDAAALRTQWPEVAGSILGNFTGKLNARETLVLKDGLGNPVNTLRFFQDGWSDGGGSSLELTDPRADNANPDVWADSDESGRSAWQTVTYRLASGQAFGNTYWNEFRLGLLDAGEVLVDDVSVIRDPDGARQQLIQNGDFETSSGNTHWRMLGDHGESRIIVDPDNPANHVLRVVASAPARSSHNHIESMFVGNTPLVDGQTYEVSFRARWRAGSPQVNTGGYMRRLAQTTLLPLPSRHGTPGAINSRWVANAGPTFTELKHLPIIPKTNEPVTVSVWASDPDGVAAVALNYRVNPATTFATTPMTLQSDGAWTASLPARAAGTIVQFYVSAQDGLGATAFAPALGPDSRALYQVADNQGANLPAHELRVIQLDADRDYLLQMTNRLSQAFRGATIIYDRSEVFYDGRLRLHGSAAGRARDGDDYVGYTVAFPSRHVFRGSHTEINLDRSGRSPVARQQDEIYLLHMFHRAGLTCHRCDLCYFIPPYTVHTGTAILQLGVYDALYVKEMYPSDGSVFTYDITYEPSVTVDGAPESVKLPVPMLPQLGTDFTDLGNDPEQYRAPFDMRHGTRADYNDGLIRLCQTLGLPQAQFDARIAGALEVDEALRISALIVLAGVGDIYFSSGGLPHNLRLFTPLDGRPAHFLPWDMDFLFSNGTSSPIYPGSDKNFYKFLNNPATHRLYLSHLNDLCQTVFTPDYITPWLAHYGSVVGQNYAGSVNYIQARRSYVLSQLPARQPFAITLNGGNGFQTNVPTVTLAGSGWLDIGWITLLGSTTPLPLTWVSDTNWQAVVPLPPGTNVVALAAYDRTGQLLATNRITVTNVYPVGNLTLDSITVGQSISLGFRVLAGWNYRIEFTDSLTGSPWLKLADIPPQPADGLQVITDSAPVIGNRFYRLVVPAPP